MATPIINIKNMHFGFENEQGEHLPLFEGFDLSIERGQFICIVGPSGCGKTSLIRLIAGLLKPFKGSININLKQQETKRRRAFMFQDARLLPWRRTLGNVLFALEALSVSKMQARDIALENLKMVGLEDHINKFPHQLSGGQRQRVAIARALSVGAELLLMDEPFSALDSYTRHELQDDLLSIWQKTGKTILFITHDMHEAEYLADRIITFSKNAKVESDKAITNQRPRKRK